jgi:Fe-S oxidoreductase
MSKEKYLSDFRPMMERCSNCLACKWIPYDKIQSQRFGENCPESLYYKFFTYSARGKMQSAQALQDGDYGYTDGMLEAAASCLSCGACDVACKVTRYNLEPLDFNIALKNDAVSKGNVLPAQKAMIDSLKNEQTMLAGMKKADRTAWSEGLGLVDALREPCDALFFPSYDEKLRKSARKAVKVLQSSGIKLGYLCNADTCCAGRAYQQGFFDEFSVRAEANINAIEKTGVSLIVTPCADCYYVFKRLYAEKGLKVQVMHVVEYLEKLINDGKLTFTKKLDLKVTYHDPCHLGRLGEPYIPWDGKENKIMNQVHIWEPSRPRYNGAYGIYDAPRNVIRAIPGVTLVEMERIREYSFCCGAGGGCSETYPEFSAWTASERVTEAASTGADTIVTACPCETNLSGFPAEDGKKMKVLDIIDLVVIGFEEVQL